ncbi:MAG: bifunctional riboflavin kinase/FMN adenylyltransferase [Defluviitaleaceae bacterium]|nr:bifunctional riboflavin kinase/FMN adenylyltransferase [Defluviitaleaceae bacterium]
MLHNKMHDKACVLAVGKFEGIHIGHRELISELVRRARESEVAAVIAIFEPHPFKFLRDADYKPLFSPHERDELIYSLGVNEIVTFDFDEKFAAMSARDFCEKIFGDLGAQEIIAGENFRFGRGREGTLQTLRKAGSVFVVSQKSAPSAHWAPGTHVEVDTFPRSREQLPSRQKSAPSAHWAPETHVEVDTFSRSRERLPSRQKSVPSAHWAPETHVEVDTFSRSREQLPSRQKSVPSAHWEPSREQLPNPQENFGGEIVSTSRIRELLAENNFCAAERFLGFAFFIEGTVEKGRQVGRVLGFPTLNIYPPVDKFLPQNGVYATRTIIDGAAHASVTNIGISPTVSDGSRFSVESHVLNFQSREELYGTPIKVEFLRFIRPEKKFASTDELKMQIQKDIESRSAK